MTETQNIETESSFAWPFRRASDEGMLAGVAAGIAKALGIDAIYVRAGFLVLGLAGGTGVLLYLLGALIVPEEDPEDPVVPEVASRSQTIGIFAMFLATLLILKAAGVWFAVVVFCVYGGPDHRYAGGSVEVGVLEAGAGRDRRDRHDEYANE